MPILGDLTADTDINTNYWIITDIQIILIDSSASAKLLGKAEYPSNPMTLIKREPSYKHLLKSQVEIFKMKWANPYVERKKISPERL